MKLGESMAEDLRPTCYSSLINKVHYHSMNPLITLELWQELDVMIWDDMIAKAQFIGNAIESSKILEYEIG